MKIIKIYETLINLSAIEMYQGIEEVVISKIKKNFIGKCEKNSLIINYLDIVKMSNLRLLNSVLDGSGQVSVQFKAEAIIYEEGDILAGCEIQKIEKGNKIICKTENAIINIKGNKLLQSLKTGQKIAIRIDIVSYLKGEDIITIYGSPYSYSHKFTVFKVSENPILPEEEEIIKIKLQEIKKIEEIPVDNKKFQYFSEIYYPYTEPYNPGKYKNLKNILTLKPEVGKYYVRHPIINKSIPEVFYYSEFPSDNLFNTNVYEIKIVEETPGFIITHFLTDYLNYIKFIRDTCNIFKTDQEIESNSNIWNIYQKIKIKSETMDK